MIVWRIFMFCGVIALAACRGDAQAPLTDVERSAIAASVESETRGFENAQRNRDPEGTLAYFSPDFYMYVDGVRSGYDSVATSIRSTFGTLQYLEPGFDNVEVRVLSRDAALVSLTFRDSIITATGETIQFRGPTTLVWQRREGKWQIVYADADHYAVTSK